MSIQANGALAILGQVPAGVIFAAAPTIEALRERQQQIQAASQALIDAADEAGDDLSDEDLATIEANRVEAERIGRQITAREAVTMPGAGAGRRTVSDTAPAAPGARTVPATARRDDPRNGFKNFGEFAGAVRLGSVNGNQPDNRLTNAATTYGNEGTGSEGGFAVPPEFRREIWQKVLGEDSLLARTDRLTSSGNSLVIPKDDTTPWQTSGGIQAYWEGEGSQIPASKPSLDQLSIRLNRLTALVPVTEELLEDAPGMEAYLRNKAPQKMAAKLNTAIIDGTGVGMPLGLLRSPATIFVAKEGSQSADTILFANIIKMWSRMHADARRNAVWLINQDIEPQLFTMAFDPAGTSKVPVYLPANGLAGSPYATLMGRPVIPVQAAKTLGDAGDIILADLSQYMSVTKGADVRTDVSIHLYFDQALTTFRFIMRVAGMPWWSSAMQPENGSNTVSPFVSLAERA